MTCPRATVIRRPDAVVQVVPPLRERRDQCTVHTLPLRSTCAVPVPMLCAYGGRLPYSRNREVRTPVCWITTVTGASRPPSVVIARAPSIDTSHRPLFADQMKPNEAAGYDTDADLAGLPPGGGGPNRNPMSRALLAPADWASSCPVRAYRLYGAIRLKSR